mmetsp:Transcript_11189/g.18808  ORF Transcript_11189/g.18808 Transcript_11189/m.18808 type:complete len:398 (-) Transcript_11189:166-1359(-)
MFSPLRFAAILGLSLQDSQAMQVNDPRQAEIGASDDYFPEFEINLDLEPKDRFKEVAATMREQILETSAVILEEIPSELKTLFDLTYWIWGIVNHERYSEIQGIVEAVDSRNLDIQTAVLINSLYELGAWCTSIVAKQADNSIIHQRNLDFDATNFMRSITHRAKFFRGGEHLFSAVMFAGNVGIYTGMKPGQFSISQNTRAPKTNKLGLLENLSLLFSGVRENSWIVRDVLTDCPDFTCAHKHLSTDATISYGYFILAGVYGDEGVVISRDRFGTAHEDWLNAENGTWYLVQTNNDHWDTGCFNRCAAARDHMNEIGQHGISNVTLKQRVLNIFPNLNRDTIYNTQFQAGIGYMNTTPQFYNGSSLEQEVFDPSLPDDSPTIRLKDLFEGFKVQAI